MLLVKEDECIVELVDVWHWLNLKVWSSWSFLNRGDKLLFKLLNLIHKLHGVIFFFIIEVIVFFCLSWSFWVSEPLMTLRPHNYLAIPSNHQLWRLIPPVCCFIIMMIILTPNNSSLGFILHWATLSLKRTLPSITYDNNSVLIQSISDELIGKYWLILLSSIWFFYMLVMLLLCSHFRLTSLKVGLWFICSHELSLAIDVGSFANRPCISRSGSQYFYLRCIVEYLTSFISWNLRPKWLLYASLKVDTHQRDLWGWLSFVFNKRLLKDDLLYLLLF